MGGRARGCRAGGGEGCIRVNERKRWREIKRVRKTEKQRQGGRDRQTDIDTETYRDRLTYRQREREVYLSSIPMINQHADSQPPSPRNPRPIPHTQGGRGGGGGKH